MLGLCPLMPAQDPGGLPPDLPPGGGPPGFGGPGFGGPGRPGGMGRAPEQIAERFDADKNGRLDRQERDAARQWLGENGQRRGGPGGGPGGMRGGRRGGPGPMGGTEAGKPGPRLSPADVDSHAGKDLYDPSILRTLFVQFEADDWETELEAFYNTDVDVPATLSVDGKSYVDVGVRFRGNSSYFGVPKGNKRSLNLDLDAVHKGQKLGGYKTLNLLNAHEDASFLHEALHAAIGRQFVPVPQSNLVRLVVNGECWGVYCNSQQTNKDYLAEAFGSKKDAHWKVPPDFGGGAALRYLGDDLEQYRRSYEAKSGVDDNAWWRLVELCRQLRESDDARLLRDLPQILDIDAALWFLALDNALLDGDGYLSRGSDYGLFLDEHGVFHVFPYDSNEVLATEGGPGGPRRGRGGNGPAGSAPGGNGPGGNGPGGNGPGGMRRGGPMGANPDQGPLAGADDAARPLAHRLLAIPQWRAMYLAHLRALVDSMDWQRLGPTVQQLHGLIAEAVQQDTRKLYSTERFDRSVGELQQVVQRRRQRLLADELLAGAWPQVSITTCREIAGAEGQRRLTVTARADGDIEAMTLYLQAQRPGPFAVVAMQRAADGSFTGTSADCRAGDRVHFYVEARAKSGRLGFAPAGGASGAEARRLGK